MSEKSNCNECEHAKNLQGCAFHHVRLARKMISEGKLDDADKELKNFENHLKKS